mmetsp:Transcript_54761/g.138309  ORF Transcript_54761/g.138309 Transcript_54761/m.138309 type:complete len:209 (-) Transcript_54761:305-931(-)
MYITSCSPAAAAAFCKTLPSGMPLKQFGSWVSRSPITCVVYLLMTSVRAGLPVNTRVNFVEVSSAAETSSASRCAFAIWHSCVVRKAVPNMAADAPALKASATSDPSMMPPAEMTGMPGKAATISLVNCRADGVASSSRNLPVCPPASLPWATTQSAPRSIRYFASLTLVAFPIKNTPSLFSLATWCDSGQPKWKLTTGIRCSINKSI